MTQPQQAQTLFDVMAPERAPVAPASLEHWLAILPTLKMRQLRVLLWLCEMVEHGHRADATGGELAEFACMKLLNVRPRLTELTKKSLVTRNPIPRQSTADEATAHPYRPLVPGMAVERAIRAQVKR